MKFFIYKKIKDNPYLLNDLYPNEINEKIINIALENGYQYDENSPAYLLKYKKMAEYYINNCKTYLAKELTYIENFPNLIIKIIPKININNYSGKDFDIVFLIVKTYYEYLNPKTQFNIINKEDIIYRYLNKHPEYLKNYRFKISTIKNYSELYNIFKKYNLPINYIEINEDFFLYIAKENPSILFDQNVSAEIIVSERTANVFIENEKKGKIKLESVDNTMLLNNIFLIRYYLNEDFQNIIFFKNTNHPDIIFKTFLENLPEYFKYLKLFSNIFPNIDNKIFENQLLLKLKNEKINYECSWDFINDYYNNGQDNEEITDENDDDLIDKILLLKDKNNIKYLLPDKDDIDYWEDMNKIIKKITHKSFGLSSKEELIKCKEILTYIKKYMQEDENDKVIEKKKEEKNVIIFGKSMNGNILALSDIKKIDSHYYEEILDLLKKIEKTEIIKNKEKNRFFTNNNNLLKVFEYKGYQIRIICKRLPKNAIYVEMIRIKKSQNSKLDMLEPISRNNNLLKDYEYIYNLFLNNEEEELVKEHEIIKEDIIQFLKPKTRVK